MCMVRLCRCTAVAKTNFPATRPDVNVRERKQYRLNSKLGQNLLIKRYKCNTHEKYELFFSAQTEYLSGKGFVSFFLSLDM